MLSSFGYDDLMPSHFYSHVSPTAFDDVSEYDTAFTAVAMLFAAFRKRLLPLKPKMVELAPLLLSGAPASRVQPLIEAMTAAMVECLKGEKEELVTSACRMLAASFARFKASNAPSTGKAAGAAAKPGSGGAAGASAASRAKMEATERLMAEMTSISHELSVRKSGQESILHGRYRIPRYDRGQRVSVLDTSHSSPHKHIWRDGTVLHGGPMLCEVDEAGRVVVWGARAEKLTGVIPMEAIGEQWEEVLLRGADDMLMHAQSVAKGVIGGETSASLFESVVMPLNVNGPMTIAPLLVRATERSTQAAADAEAANGAAGSQLPSGCTHAEARAIVIEAGTGGIHMISFDGERASVTATSLK